MIVKLQTEHHLEFLGLTGGCGGSSESTLEFNYYLIILFEPILKLTFCIGIWMSQFSSCVLI